LKKSSIIFFILFIPWFSFSQEIQIFHFKKEHAFVFFQKGTKSDTIIKNKNDVFYFIVPDSLKNRISVLVENGQLQTTSNDSLVKLNYLFGMKYETFFQKNGNGEQKLRTLTNGATEHPRQNILLEVLDRKTGNMILKNTFFYLE